MFSVLLPGAKEVVGKVASLALLDAGTKHAAHARTTHALRTHAYSPCTRYCYYNAHAVHLPCTRSTHYAYAATTPLHTLCTRYAHAMHTRCFYVAPYRPTTSLCGVR
eukprot:1636817-Rhodomonas_salina.1